MSIKSIDEKKIAEAISDFESAVDFEFVPVICENSSYVEHIQWMISLILLLLFVGFIDGVFYDSWGSKTYYYLAAPILAIILGTILDKSDIVDRFFISKPERIRQAFEKAQRIFFLQKLNEVKTNNSLLLFISVMERQIVLLPDPKIEKLSSEQLRKLTESALQILQTNFKASKFEDGLIETIKMLKIELQEHFPRTSNSTNEVANKLIWWND
jgi:uncharacterized membrane protein